MEICLLGDVMLGRTFDTLYSENPNYCWISNPLKTWIESSDLTIGNLETSITDSSTKFPNKVFNFKISPNNFKRASKCLRFNFLNLANNHILDYKYLGMIDTMETLDSLNIKYGGVRIHREDEFLPVEVNKYITIFSLSTHPRNFNDYVNISEDMRDLISSIKEYRRSYKGIIICSLHSGDNYIPEFKPTPEMKGIYRSLIDAGANIIHGHSPHHLLPHEFYNEGLIFYSLGDFIDDYAIDPVYRNDLSAVVKVKVDKKGSIDSFEVQPTRIHGMKVSAIDSEDPDYKWTLSILSI